MQFSKEQKKRIKRTEEENGKKLTSEKRVVAFTCSLMDVIIYEKLLCINWKIEPLQVIERRRGKIKI